MSINPLNDISRVYLEQVASVDEGMTMKDFKKQRSRQKQKEKRAADKIAPNRRSGIHADKASPERAARHRANVDPDFEGNDERNYPGGKLNPKKVRKAKALGELGESAVPGKPAEKLGAVTTIPKSEQEAARERLLAKAKAIRAQKGIRKEALDPVGKEDADIDNDGDTDKSDKYLHKRRKAIGKAIGVRKEGFSNWRQDLAEVMDDVEANKKIKEKKVENKVVINPNIKEGIENIGGILLEEIEIDEFDFILESSYDELIEEGYDEDDIEEALEYALIEAKVTFGHDTAPASAKKKRESLLNIARKKLAGAKASAKTAVARGARKVAKGALGVARKMEGGDKKPHTAERKPSTYRGAGAGTKEKVSSGSYTPPTTLPKEKTKATTKKTAAPKTKAPATSTTKKKRRSKLDDLLSDIRSEQVQIDEKTLTAAETKEKERIVKSMKDKVADFEKRYPGRGKEVMYATATKMAKKMTEQALELQPKTQEKPQEKKKPLDTTVDRQKFANLKIMHQKQQQLQRQKLNLQKQGKLPLEAD